MARVTSLTADRMLLIEGGSVVSGEVRNGRLMLTRHDGISIDAGSVVGQPGEPGPPGPPGESGVGRGVLVWKQEDEPLEAIPGDIWIAPTTIVEFLPPFTDSSWTEPNGISGVVRAPRDVSFQAVSSWLGLSLWGWSGLTEGEVITVSVEATSGNARIQTWFSGVDPLQFPSGTGARTKTFTVPSGPSGLFDVVIASSTAGPCSVTGLSFTRGVTVERVVRLRLDDEWLSLIETESSGGSISAFDIHMINQIFS